METIWIEEYDDLKDNCKRLRRQLKKLKKAANDLYDAGYWTCDRTVDDIALWESLRDALRRKKGNSPDRKYIYIHRG